MSQFSILPTTDIHLVLENTVTNGRVFTLKFQLTNAKLSFNEQLLEFDDYNQALISITKDFSDSKNLQFSINALNSTGITFIRVKYNNVQECFIRVWIHETIGSISINNNHLTICSGNDYHGYVPSVIATFNNNEICDITYHPYLKYQEVVTPNRLSINNHVVTAPQTVTSNVESKIQISINGKENIYDEVSVTITKKFESERRILEKIHIGTDTTEHINLLIIAEGFKKKGDFRLYVNGIKDSLFSNILSPWHFIKDRLTIWTAFEASMDTKEGITVNNPVNKMDSYMPNFDGDIKPDPDCFTLEELINEVGLPNNSSPQTYSAAMTSWSTTVTDKLQEEIFLEWLNYNSIKGYIENKDSVLGICIGMRLGDKIESQYIESPETSVFNWYKPAAQQREMMFDRRRYPTDNLNFGNVLDSELSISRTTGQVTISDPAAMDKYLGSLKYVEPATGNVKDIGKTWQTTGKDSRLIAIACNHYKWGGTNTGYQHTHPITKEIVAIIKTAFFTLFDNYKYDITPHSTLPFKLSDNVNALNLYTDFDSVLISALMAHELMHSFDIGDEYEGRIGGPDISDTEVNSKSNLTTIYTIKKDDANPIGARIIDPTEIKWNLRRVALSSIIVSDTIKNGSNITIKVDKDQSAKWKRVFELKDTSNNPVILPLYIRSSVYDKSEKKIFYQIAIEKIVSVNTSTQTIVLKVKDSEISKLDIGKLKKGSHIFLPKRLGNDYDPLADELLIINPRVFEYMKNTEKALSNRTECQISNDHPNFPPTDKIINEATGSTYPTFSSPNNRFLVSGAYEGGGDWNCFVFRPNGWSHMRKHILKNTDISEINLDTGENITIEPSVSKPAKLRDIAIYGRFDFFTKYFFLAVNYATKLEDLDREEYTDYDSTNL